MDLEFGFFKTIFWASDDNNHVLDHKFYAFNLKPKPSSFLLSSGQLDGRTAAQCQKLPFLQTKIVSQNRMTLWIKKKRPHPVSS